VAYVFHNSRLDLGVTHILTLQRGQLRKLGDYVPHWVEEAYGEPIARYRSELVS
jgi:hypothetical protein